jgi:hypothetical protein
VHEGSSREHFNFRLRHDWHAGFSSSCPNAGCGGGCWLAPDQSPDPESISLASHPQLRQGDISRHAARCRMNELHFGVVAMRRKLNRSRVQGSINRATHGPRSPAPKSIKHSCATTGCIGNCLNFTFHIFIIGLSYLVSTRNGIFMCKVVCTCVQLEHTSVSCVPGY